MRTSVKFMVIYRHKDKYSISEMCRFFNVSRSGYYDYVKRMDIPAKDLPLAEKIKECQDKCGRTYGYRRVHIWLEKNGIHHNPKTILRVMRKYNLLSVVRRKKYRNYGDHLHRYPNLLNRDFKADRPNQKWVTDVTEFHLFGEKLYLSPILDLHSRDIVSYVISERPVLSMVTTMLEKAFAKLSDSEVVLLHSDQGWQYQHKQYQRMLREKGIQQSMSNKGNCLDNAVMENFFGLLKSELLYLQEFESMDHFKQELVEYLDYYNNRRIKTKLKGLPPALHRQQALLAA